jgi:hypothetical protein
VQLLVTVKQRQARIVGDEGELNLLHGAERLHRLHGRGLTIERPSIESAEGAVVLDNGDLNRFRGSSSHQCASALQHHKGSVEGAP